jgi:hypothetical protein
MMYISQGMLRVKLAAIGIDEPAQPPADDEHRHLTR